MSAQSKPIAHKPVKINAKSVGYRQFAIKGDWANFLFAGVYFDKLV